MADFTNDIIQKVWNKGSVLDSYDESKYRKDCTGAWMIREEYGTESAYGWEVDHVYPESEGGDESLVNLRPMQWKNNRSKSDDYPNYKVSIIAEEDKNVEKIRNLIVNEGLQDKLKNLYNLNEL